MFQGAVQIVLGRGVEREQRNAVVAAPVLLECDSCEFDLQYLEDKVRPL